MGGRGARSRSALRGGSVDVGNIDTRISDLEKRRDQLSERMSELAVYAMPSSYDADRANKYYVTQQEFNDVRMRLNELYDERRRLVRAREANAEADREHVRQREREITTTTYERAQRRLREYVNNVMGFGRR